jgi:hypothetical protein
LMEEYRVLRKAGFNYREALAMARPEREADARAGAET